MASSARTLVCSVLFLDIVEYTKQPVAEQSQLKHEFNELLAEALERIRPKERILVDTGDGAAVAFLGDPQEALLVAVAMRDAQSSIPLRQGINLGPVQLIKDLNGRLNVIGTGINSAQRVMDFALPGQILVSRAFYEVVSCLSADHAGVFRREGSRADKHVREHELFSVVSSAAVAERLAASAGHLRKRTSLRQWLAAAGPLGFHRAALLVAPLVFLATAAVGIGLRGGGEAKRASAPQSVQVSAPVKAPAPAVVAQSGEQAATPAAQSPTKTAPTKVRKPASERAAAQTQSPAPAAGAGAAASGRLRLAITPWGEVYVDGELRGVSPTLQFVKLPPGPHTVEIRNSSLPPRVERIEIRSGETIEIKHKF
jgi:class 3 adenylate cyclase